MKLASITVTFNPDLLVLEEQILSLKEQVSVVVIVDNCSLNICEIRGLSVKYHCLLVELSENKGLGYAQNIGVELVEKNEASHFLFFDHDSVPSDTMVESMMQVYLDQNVDILGPQFHDPVTKVIYPGTNYLGPFINRADISYVTDVTFVIASGTLLSMDCWKKIGNINEDLFVDYMDVEWCLRAKSKGLRVSMTNCASMSHTIGDQRRQVFGRTISVHSPRRRYYLCRNSLYMLKLSYVPLGYKLRELTLNVCRAIVSIWYSDKKLETCKLIIKGFHDGFVGRWGKLNED